MRKRVAKKILKEIRFRPDSYSNCHKFGNTQFDRAFKKMRPYLNIPQGAWLYA